MGTTTAYALLMSGAASEIVLIGMNRERIEGHVNDLRDAASYSHPGRIVAGDFADRATADVIIVTVGAPQRRDARSRLDANSNELIDGTIISWSPLATRTGFKPTRGCRLRRAIPWLRTFVM